MSFLYGGPLDGTEAENVRGFLYWFDKRGRAHAEPGKGNVLYFWSDDHWAFDARMWVCSCGCVTDAQRCGICGHETLR